MTDRNRPVKIFHMESVLIFFAFRFWVWRNLPGRISWNWYPVYSTFYFKCNSLNWIISSLGLNKNVKTCSYSFTLMLSIKLVFWWLVIPPTNLSITNSSSATGPTRRWLGNSNTYPWGAFQHITKSSSHAGRFRHIRTLFHPAADGQVFLLPRQCLMHPKVDDDFAINLSINFWFWKTLSKTNFT